jgi:ZIP family zinc transporter
LPAATSFLGTLISKYKKFDDQQILFLTPFGTGILPLLPSLKMVIEAKNIVGATLTALCFIGGSILFTIADIIAERTGVGAGILLGIRLDSIPELLAIGASVAAGLVLVIATLIGIQNVPEGIASYREMRSGTAVFSNSKKVLFCYRNSIKNSNYSWFNWFILFTRNNIYIIGLILSISAEDIFYMLHNDIIPKAHEERKWLPTFSAVLEFISEFAVIRVI